MITFTFDQTRLNKAVADRLNVLSSSRTPQQICDTAAFWIAVNARKYTPFTTQARIDTELNVTTTPRLFKSGKPMKTKKIRAFGNLGAAGRTLKSENAPYLALIIQARATLGSHYNELTHDRWESGYSLFAGVSRQEGAALMKAAMERALSARHSSTHYLASTWLAPQRILYPYAVRSWGRGSSSEADSGAQLDSSINARGTATPAGSGLNVQTVIEGMTGTLGKQSDRQNEAFINYGGPALQQAVDEEAQMMEVYTNKAMAKGNAAFNAYCALP